MKKLFKITLVLLLNTILMGGVQAKDRWSINDKGGITWNIGSSNYPHSDHIEMSGREISTVLRYGVDSNKAFHIKKSFVFPMLRTIPNNTHGSLMRRLNWDAITLITIDGRSATEESVEWIELDGTLTVQSTLVADKKALKLTRQYAVSTQKAILVESYVLENCSDKSIIVEIPDYKSTIKTDRSKGVDGIYYIESATDKSGAFKVEPNGKLEFGAYTVAYSDVDARADIDVQSEIAKRKTLVNEWTSSLVLETPSNTINKMFTFSKIRALESIFATKGGAMHAPGGESYYAAIWANDQAEYINPYFPFTGYEYGNESAINSFKHFARFMNDKWEPIPSSIIAQGDDIWNGAGDRGDAAMIAYGAARYALAKGSKEEAKQLWPLIEWCLEFCERKLNSKGVVRSDSDELENRFPAGDANLCTSSLYYDALLSSSYLAKELGLSLSSKYLRDAKNLRKSIETYFGSEVEGFDTYAYYEGNDILRSWICIPLTVGIDERAEETINALLSDRLWSKDGLLTEAGSETYWDRSTLYALRGLFAVGATERAIDVLDYYSTTRLLGEHVPYAIEAWPEGNQRHLSAESGLYGRIITEGLFGIRPTGLKSFTLTPRMPKDWDFLNLKNIKSFDSSFDINIKRIDGDKMEVTIIDGDRTWVKTMKHGETLKYKF